MGALVFLDNPRNPVRYGFLPGGLRGGGGGAYYVAGSSNDDLAHPYDSV